MLHRHGGPPVASFFNPSGTTIAPAPLAEKSLVSATPGPDQPEAKPAAPVPSLPQQNTVDDDAESDGIGEGAAGVDQDFLPSKELPLPTFTGFQIAVRRLNPNLASYLFERLGHEQVRRYKRLLENKKQHVIDTAGHDCKSGDRCSQQGGRIDYLTGRGHKEPQLSHTGFSAAALGDDDEDEGMNDGVVSEAQFPAGIPLPPAKKLPAEFECQLCFQVKKFHKPSDWSKHVHEDLQPFTCTFSNCPDPKSFKRKADWVRHENERHRQLEWWVCSENGCNHKCYRRDNFVQHLVREHRMPEPSAKAHKPGKPAVRGPAKPKVTAAEDKVSQMIKSCKKETTKQAIQERCRFCGDVCNSWKKLTVHLARHMEQLSMPILELVKQKDVSADTLISPLQDRPTYYNPTPSPVGSHVSGNAPFPVPADQSAGGEGLPGNFQPIPNSTSFYPNTGGTYGHWPANPQIQNNAHNITYPNTVDQTYPNQGLFAAPNEMFGAASMPYSNDGQSSIPAPDQYYSMQTMQQGPPGGYPVTSGAETSSFPLMQDQMVGNFSTMGGTYPNNVVTSHSPAHAVGPYMAPGQAVYPQQVNPNGYMSQVQHQRGRGLSRGQMQQQQEHPQQRQRGGAQGGHGNWYYGQ